MAAAGRDRGFACAKAVDASTRPGVGISATARTPNACSWSGAGRRRADKPNVAVTRRPKHSTPRHKEHAVGAPLLRRNLRRNLTFQRRVVTQQKFFHRLPCATGPGAMKRPSSQAATSHTIAVSPAARPFAGCWIANASGCDAAHSKAAALAIRNIRPLACAATANHPTQPARHRHGHRHFNHVHRPSRSAVAGLAAQSPLAWHNVFAFDPVFTSQESQA